MAIGRDLDRGEVLSQYGMAVSEPVYRNRPRVGLESAVSVILGEVSAETACLMVHGRPVLMVEARVRHTSVGRVIDQGFRVLHTPSRRMDDHVSVERDGVWGDDEARLFDECFAEEVTDV